MASDEIHALSATKAACGYVDFELQTSVVAENEVVLLLQTPADQLQTGVICPDVNTLQSHRASASKSAGKPATPVKPGEKGVRR